MLCAVAIVFSCYFVCWRVWWRVAACAWLLLVWWTHPNEHKIQKKKKQVIWSFADSDEVGMRATASHLIRALHRTLLPDEQGAER